jgi:transcriptional regulator of acetoin/glycerol metabolism
MGVSRSRRAAAEGQVKVSRARERFLSGEVAADTGVSTTIVASWKRSRESRVDTGHAAIPFFNDWDRDSPLLTGADPVLDSLRQHLYDEPVSLLLTNRTGLVLDRRVTDRALRTRLDKMSLAPGFSYAEEFAGTNGIGTAISSGDAVLVSGHAHYVEDLVQFSCAGVPVHHPTRGVTLGVLDLTSWAHAPGGMLTALAKTAARQIEAELLSRAGRRELAMFQAYLEASQRPGSMVLAMGSSALMMNERMRLTLGPDEQQALIGYAAEMLRCTGATAARTVELPSRRCAHIRCIPVDTGADYAGAVFSVRLLRRDVRQPPTRTPAHENDRPSSPSCLAGSSPPWLRCVELVRSGYEAGDWLALTGEPGTGKQALLRAVHLQHNPTHGFRVLKPPSRAEATAWADELSAVLSTTTAMVVIAHADTLEAEAARVLASRLRDLRSDLGVSRPARVAVTTTGEGAWEGKLAALFPTVIEVPPLRHHLDDLRELSARLLARAAGDTHPSLSEAALAQLARLDWPGNIAQLGELLVQAAKRRRSGTIELGDLPAEARTAGHRRLTPIEALERDAIVQALLGNSQSPSKAAAALGISRATIYRKLRRYGISLPIVQ